MKIKLTVFTIIVLMTACTPKANLSSSRSLDYAIAVKSAIGVLKWDLEGFYFRSSPVGNFGIGTMYLNESNSKDPRVIESHWLLSNPSIWFRDTLPNEEKQKILNQIIVKGEYGSIDFNDSTGRKINSKVSLPLFNALGIDAGIDFEKGVKSALSADQAVLRKIAWPEFVNVFKNKKLSSTVEEVVKEENYTIVASDIVLTKYKITIEVDKMLNPTLDVKLNEAIGNVIAKDGQAGLTFKKVANGKFQLIAKDDVVAAILFKVPPAINKERGDKSNWENATVSEEEILKLEHSLSGR